MIKPPREKRNSSKSPATRPSGQRRWIVVIDEQPIRRAASRAYGRLEKQIGRHREQIEAFEGGDLPAYNRWEARVFGALLTELRSTISAMEAKKRILDAIEQETAWTGCSVAEAYRRVTTAKNEPPVKDEDESWREEADGFDDPESESGGSRLYGDSDLPPDFDIDRFDRSSAAEKAKFVRSYTSLAALFEMFSGRKAPPLKEVLERERRKRTRGPAQDDAESNRRAQADSEASPTAPAAKQAADRVKELYRKLVRQLHPDANRNQTPREKELWHQLQAAYRAGDLELMEAVAGRLEISLNGNSSRLPVQVLLRMTRELRNATRGLRRQIENARRHPAWAFRQKASELPKIEAQRRRQIEEDSQFAREELARFTEALDDLAARARKPSCKKKKARREVRETMDGMFRF